jgi:WD40 repeat protein
MWARETFSDYHNRSVTALKYSPNRDLIASSCNGATVSFLLISFAASDQTCSILNSRTFQRVSILNGKHAEGLNDVEWFHHSGYLATASDDKNIIIWDVETVCGALLSFPPPSELSLPLLFLGQRPLHSLWSSKFCVFFSKASVSEPAPVRL